MLKVVTLDGAIFIGQNHRDVVRAMRDDVWDPPERLEEYMADVQRRVGQMVGEEICADDPRQFLMDLRQLGMVDMDEAVM